MTAMDGHRQLAMYIHGRRLRTGTRPTRTGAS
jgi:hypothetical protein